MLYDTHPARQPDRAACGRPVPTEYNTPGRGRRRRAAGRALSSSAGELTLLETLYRMAIAAAGPLLPAVGAVAPRLAVVVAGRRVASASIRAWARRARDPARPLLWLHGASAGELAGAAPALECVRDRVPDMQLLVTYSSPSAERTAPGLLPDYAGYLPIDTLRECRGALVAVAPAALVFAKLDAWPVLTRAAADMQVPLGMINATVRQRSSRLRPLARSLLRSAYRRMDLVGAVARADAGRLERLGVDPNALRITGDAAFDQALGRVAAARARPAPGKPHLPPCPSGSVRLLAGSTWLEDEAVLLRAAAQLSGGDPPMELILVPHEPRPAALRRIARLCLEELGVRPRLFSELDAAEWRAGQDGATDATGAAAPVVIDTVGILADLYLEADVGFVGGALGDTGLHSVIEPAAAGLPVLFGNRHDRWEADELLARGAALQVEAGNAAEVLRRLLSDVEGRKRMAAEARRYVEEGRGSARSAADLVEELMRRGRRSPSARG